MSRFDTSIALAAAIVWVAYGHLDLVARLRRLPEGADGWAKFRRIVKWHSMGNLAFGSVAAAYGISDLIVSGLSARLYVGAAIFFLLALALQVILAVATHPSMQELGVVSWDRSAYLVRLVSAQFVLVLPMTLTTVLAGSVLGVVNAWPQPAVSPESLALYAACLIWIVQWPAVRLASLPGAPADMPTPEWENSAMQLAQEMDVKLNDILLLRTHRAPMAGAFALSGNRAAITDHFLSALTLQEFRAVMAHEFAHFKQRRASGLAFLIAMISILGASSGAMWIASRESLNDFAVSFLFLGIIWVCILPLVRQKAQHEDEADEIAIKHTDPFDLMTGIAKAYALNGRLKDRTGDTVHRSLSGRLERIAKLGNLDSDAVNRAFEVALPFDPTSSMVFLAGREARQS